MHNPQMPRFRRQEGGKADGLPVGYRYQEANPRRQGGEEEHYRTSLYVKYCLAWPLFLSAVWSGLVWFLTKQQYYTVAGKVLSFEK